MSGTPRPSTRRSVPTLLAVLLVTLACGGQGTEQGEAVRAPDDTIPADRDTAVAEADTAPADTTGAERTTPYYVHLEPGADPAEVADRHGIEPIEIIREPRPALYVALTDAQRERLQQDSLVRSLAREIHAGEGGGAPPIRGIRPDTAPGVVRDGDRVRGTGTVRRYDLEGGFHAIRGDDSVTYDPVDLPEAFSVDGLEVWFEGVLHEERVGIRMVGPIIELEEIRRRDDGA